MNRIFFTIAESSDSPYRQRLFLIFLLTCLEAVRIRFELQPTAPK
jgi:hypothetical protein